MTVCPSCGAELPESAISSALRAARCPSCQALSDLSGGALARPRRSLPPMTPTPPGWKVEDRPRAFNASWNWITWRGAVMVPFTIAWNAFLIFAAVGVSNGFEHPERLLFGLILPHTWVGVWLLYTTLATFLNRTRVEAKNGTLTVHQGPLPWPGNRELQTSQLTQLFVLEKRRSRGTLTYELCAATRDGRQVSVVTGLHEAASARFLEIRLEHALDLQDRPVAGELPRER